MSQNPGNLENSSNSLFHRVQELIKKYWSVRFIRFLFVGGLNTLFGYLVYSGLILLHFHYAIASLISTISGILFNFFTTGRIVFNNKNSKLLFRFIAVYGITYLIGLIFLKMFDIFHANMIIAGAILILPNALIAYSLNKILVFRDKVNTEIK